MFTGIVTDLGRIAGIEHADGAARLRVDTTYDDLVEGESIAVSGVCLTVASHDGPTFTADMMPETLRRTSLGDRAAGDRVNLERALRANDRMGGHIVQGHVDGVGQVVSREPGSAWDVVTVRVPADLAKYLAVKGSVAVDGVSLTVTDAGADTFAVSLIPTTLAATSLGDATEGTRVNIEVDVVAKYIERLLAHD